MTSRLRPLLFGLLASMAALASTNAKEPDTHFPEKLPDELFAGKPYLVTVAPEFQRYFTAPIFSEVGQGLGTKKNPFKTYAIIYDGIHAPEWPTETYHMSAAEVEKNLDSCTAEWKTIKYACEGWLLTNKTREDVLKNLHPKSPLREHQSMQSTAAFNANKEKIFKQENPNKTISNRLILKYQIDYKENKYLFCEILSKQSTGETSIYTAILALHNDQWMAYGHHGTPTFGILSRPIKNALMSSIKTKNESIKFTNENHE